MKKHTALSMQSFHIIEPISWGLALAVAGLEELYLTLYLVYAHYYPRSFSQRRRCLLKAAFVTYTLALAAFLIAFFITRQISRTHTPLFVLFCTWQVLNGLCLGAQIVRVAEY